MLKKILAVSTICLIGASAVFATELGDKREASMKKIGGSMAVLAGITKGDKPYDAAAVKMSLETINAEIKTFPSFFIEGQPDTEGEVKATIWENMADFKAKAADLEKTSADLVAALPADQAAVGAAMKALGANCGACHEVYRQKK